MPQSDQSVHGTIHQARPRLHARLVVRTLGVAIRNKSGGHTHSESRFVAG